ncbi:MAG: pyridoxal-phosphate dependent enzyme [Verrucomicrobiae bacterium]|nr:pyridoxal-phosphate dependent enzyme [Verrucomicrobiae bacterium]
MKFAVDGRFTAEQSIALRYAAFLDGALTTDELRANSLREGVRILDLGEWHGVRLKLLDESSWMASGTYKSLDGCLSAAFCRKRGIRRVVFSSGANTGVALTIYGALAGLETFFFCPAANFSKLDGTIFDRAGAHLVAVEGSDRRVKQAARLAAARLDAPQVPTLEWRLLSAGLRGMFLAEQVIRHGQRFDWLAQAVCAGYGPLGIYRVFEKLALERAPRFLAVQQAGLCPIVNAWQRRCETLPPLVDAGWREKPIEPALYNVYPDQTYPELFRVLQRWGGDAISVSQADFAEFGEEFQGRVEAAGVTLGRMNGQVVERAGLLAGAGALKAIAEGWISKGATVLCALTGGAGPVPSRPATPERWIRLEEKLDAD